ncbi:hypothetical protein [Streptomyces sp. NPDC003032]
MPTVPPDPPESASGELAMLLWENFKLTLIYLVLALGASVVFAVKVMAPPMTSISSRNHTHAP